MADMLELAAEIVVSPFGGTLLIGLGAAYWLLSGWIGMIPTLQVATLGGVVFALGVFGLGTVFAWAASATVIALPVLIVSVLAACAVAIVRFL